MTDLQVDHMLNQNMQLHKSSRCRRVMGLSGNFGGIELCRSQYRVTGLKQTMKSPGSQSLKNI